VDHTNTPDTLSLLCTRCQGPDGCRANNSFDEISPAHAMIPMRL
jgi:hypothetical protein